MSERAIAACGPWVGREVELAAVARHLSEGRAAALFGPPGSGKTALARKIVEQRLRAGRPAVFLACADGLAARLPSGAAGLVVLDGLDRAPAALLLEWQERWRRSDTIELLTTSRRRVDSDRIGSIEIGPLPETDAAALLTDLVSRVRPEFAHEASLALLSEIVQRLDCLPLGLALASGAAGTLTPGQLAARLETEGLGALAPGLADVVSWSDLPLDDVERRFLAACAMLPGGFTLEMAEMAISPPRSVATLIHRLRDLSLLLRSQTDDGGIRFRVPRLLADARPADAARERDWLVSWATAMVERAGDGRHLLAAELPNLVAAMRIAMVAHPREAASIGLALQPFAVDSMRWPDGPDLLRALSANDLVPEPQRVRLARGAAILLIRRGQSRSAGPLLKEASSRADATGDAALAGRVALDYATWLTEAGFGDAAIAQLTRGLEIVRVAGLAPLEAELLLDLGLRHAANGRLRTSLAHIERAAAIHRAEGSAERAAVTEIFLAEVLGLCGRGVEAAERVREAIASGTLALGKAWQVLGTLHLGAGSLGEAAEPLTRARDEYERLGVPDRVLDVERDLALLEAMSGDPDQASVTGLAIVRRAKSTGGGREAEAWFTLGCIHLWRPDLHEAARCFSEAEWRARRTCPALAGRAAALSAVCALRSGSPDRTREDLARAPRQEPGEDPHLDLLCAEVGAAIDPSGPTLRSALLDAPAPTLRLVGRLLAGRSPRDPNQGPLRAAVLSGSPTDLRRATLDPAPSEGRLWWARALRDDGQLDAAGAIYRDLIGSEPLVADIRAELAEIELRAGAGPEAICSLAGASDRPPHLAAAALALAYARIGQAPLAHRLALTSLLGGPDGDRGLGAALALDALVLIGEERSAWEVLADGGVSVPLTTITGRRLRCARVQVASAMGELRDASADLARLVEAEATPSSVGPLVRALEARVALQLGQVEAACSLLAGLPDDPPDRVLAAEVADLRHHLGRLRAATPPAQATTPMGALWRARFGASTEPVANPAAEIVIGTTRAFARGAPVRGYGLASVAETPGAWAFEATLLAADCQVVEGVSSVRSVAERLAALAARSGSERHAEEARFVAWTAGGRSAAVLARWASTEQPAPVAHRRARALLGLSGALDEVDRRVVATLLERAEWFAESSPESAATIYVLDATRAEIGLPSGRLVPLADAPVLWRLIWALAAAPALSKEELVEHAWPDEDYHPLRHDNRVRVAINKLRGLLWPVDAGLIGTIPGGYAVRRPVCRVTARALDGKAG